MTVKKHTSDKTRKEIRERVKRREVESKKFLKDQKKANRLRAKNEEVKNAEIPDRDV